ncbi:MAG TPA: PDGLE domain-containing protein [Acidimicrobiales bacterium]|nr:PDGLE domain-containing protein [Acidimicrobiales bacterium]
MSRGVRFGTFLVAGLALAAALAFFVSPRASSAPDGLDKVASDEGFADRQTDHALADSPTAGYATRGVDDEGLSTGIAGLVGVAVTFAATGGLFLLLRRTRGGRPAPGRPAEGT